MILALVLVVLLTGVGCISPILTLLKLWQLKEWRIDRLSEHLKREGLVRQLFGTFRPIIAAGWLLLLAGTFVMHGDSEALYPRLGLMLLLTLAVLSCMQIGLKKQPTPVWTSKAMLMTAVSMALPLTLSIAILFGSFFAASSLVLVAILPLLSVLWVWLAWLMLKPLDVTLKSKVMNEATMLRTAHPMLTVIGITGSVGKTTTKELLAHILKKKGALSTPVHVNTEMGVAKWLTSILRDKPTDWKGILITEMGAYRRGEIRLLCSITQPTIGIVTYIGKQHIALFGGEEAIVEAKGELFEALPKNGHAFLNRDNEASASLRSRCVCEITSVGTDGRANVNALDIEETTGGIRFTVEGERFAVPLFGTHTVTSILLAISAAKKLGMDLPSIVKELATFRPLAQTFEVKTVRDVTVLDDTYNASPDSFRAAITWAAAQPHAEKVLLTDGIIELGEAEESIHTELAAAAADVFTKAYVGNARLLPFFRDGGFGDRVQPLTEASRMKSGTLLVCVGRLPTSTIEKLLPS